MITPLFIVDVDKATDEEILAAYREEGTSEGAARAFLNILRGNIHSGVIVD